MGRIRNLLRRALGRDTPPRRPPPVAAAEPTPHPYTPPPAISQPTISQPTDVNDRIRALVEADRVVLFMKGTRNQPQCGFSANVVGQLTGMDVTYTTHDVLADNDIRQGIKSFANWPTIPQLYVDGVFVGGCDIIVEMAQTGDLQKLLGVATTPAVNQASVQTIKQWLDDGLDFVFLDVRTPEEQAIATIGAKLLTRDTLPELEALPRDTKLVFMCHHGVRSQGAADAFRLLGFSDLNNMVGGIDAWTAHIDPEVPRY